MALGDYLLGLFTQALNSPLLPPALFTGYPVFFFLYFGTPHWDKLSFGERLIIGLIVGVPISIITLLITTFVSIVATSFTLSIDSTTLWYALSAIFTGLLGIARARVGMPLHSARGYHALVSFLTRDQFPYTYVATLFVLVFSVFSLWLNGSDMTSVLPIVSLVPLVFVTGVSGYFLLLFAISILIAPSRYGKLLALSLSYVFLLGRKNLLSSSEGGIQETLDPKKAKIGMQVTPTKVGAIVLVILVGVSIPMADNAVGLLTPQIVGITTQTTSPSSINFIITPSEVNFSQYVTLSPVEQTYYIREPLLPFFILDIQNPSNYANLASGMCTYLSSGCNLNGLSESVQGNVNISAHTYNGKLIGWRLFPKERNGTNTAILMLAYYNQVEPIPFSIGIPTLVNETVSGDNATAYYSITVLNPNPYVVEFAHIFLRNLPTNVTKVSGVCECQHGQTVTFDYIGYPISVNFIVQPETNGTLYLELQFPR